MAKVLQLDGLEEVALGTSVQALDGGVGVVAGGHDDRAGFRPAPFDFADEPNASATGHAQIRHNERSLPPGKQLDRLLRRRSGLALVAPEAGGTNKHVEGERLVVYHRNRSPCRVFSEAHHITSTTRDYAGRDKPWQRRAASHTCQRIACPMPLSHQLGDGPIQTRGGKAGVPKPFPPLPRPSEK